jgi:hypothetical protein
MSKVKISIDRRETFQEAPGPTLVIVLPSGKEFVLKFLKDDDIEINKSNHGLDGKSRIQIESNYPNEIIIK